jgi:hypothetical protein
MNLHQLKLDFHQLKVEYFQLELEKQQAMYAQRYEQVADCRTDQKEINEKIRVIRDTAMDGFQSLGIGFHDLQQKQAILMFLIEINPFDEAFLRPVEDQLTADKQVYRSEWAEQRKMLNVLRDKRNAALNEHNETAVASLNKEINELRKVLGYHGEE